jgi:hypothetical protein
MHIKLPKHIDEKAVEDLINDLANRIYANMKTFMEGCNLQPTTRAAKLAAEAAVCVLLAHEIGQEVNSDLAGVPETPVGG